MKKLFCLIALIAACTAAQAQQVKLTTLEIGFSSVESKGAYLYPELTIRNVDPYRYYDIEWTTDFKTWNRNISFISFGPTDVKISMYKVALWPKVRQAFFRVQVSRLTDQYGQIPSATN